MLKRASPVVHLGKKELAMSEIDVVKCPKCGGQMNSGSVAGNFRILKAGDLYGDRARVFFCRNCGFVELYKEPSVKEPWRLRVRPAEPEPQQAPTREEPRQPEKEEPGRKPVKRLVR